jgi:subtilisin-like proprotein convertase family protein
MSRLTAQVLMTGVISLVALAAANPASAATTGAFANPERITTPGTTGSAQPSPIQVSGLDGPIEQITVALRGVTHQKPEDLDILLTTPSGKKLALASDACGASNTVNASWVFASYGTADALEFDGPCPSGVYRPTNISKNDAGDSWPTAPGENFVQAYSRLHSDDANGTWAIHVVDDSPNYATSIASGWTLDLTTTTPDARLPGFGTFGYVDPAPLRTVVTGQNGVLTDVDVTVGPFWHERVEDLDMYLVGPQGQRAKLASDACGSQKLPPQSWRFDDEAARSLPDDASPVCDSVFFKPTDHGPNENAPVPAPPGPWPASLSGFDSTDPNGVWELYVWDNGDGATGWIANGVAERGPGFRVDPTVRPRARVVFSETEVRVTEGEEAKLVLERNAQGQLGAGSVTLAATPDGATQGADHRPLTPQVSFAAGDARKTISVETIADELAEGEESLTLTIGQGAGDAQPGSPASARVTLRDPERGGDGDQNGDGARIDTTIDKAPKRKIVRRTTRVAFSASEDGATFECSLDRKPFAACTSPRRLKRLRPGRHTFQVRAIGADGNADPTPATRRWRVVGS